MSFPVPQLNYYSSRRSQTMSEGKWGCLQRFLFLCYFGTKIQAWACDLREILSRKLEVYFPLSVFLHGLPSAAFANCIWHRWRYNVVIYCFSGAITFGGRHNVKASRGSRNCPMREISKTLLNAAWFPETCNRDSCWSGSAAEERGIQNPRFGNVLEVGTRDSHRPLPSPARRSSGAPTAIGKGACRLCLLSPCFFPCEVGKGRPLQG